MNLLTGMFTLNTKNQYLIVISYILNVLFILLYKFQIKFNQNLYIITNIIIRESVNKEQHTATKIKYILFSCLTTEFVYTWPSSLMIILIIIPYFCIYIESEQNRISFIIFSWHFESLFRSRIPTWVLQYSCKLFNSTLLLHQYLNNNSKP